MAYGGGGGPWGPWGGSGGLRGEAGLPPEPRPGDHANHPQPAPCFASSVERGCRHQRLLLAGDTTGHRALGPHTHPPASLPRCRRHGHSHGLQVCGRLSAVRVADLRLSALRNDRSSDELCYTPRFYPRTSESQNREHSRRLVHSKITTMNPFYVNISNISLQKKLGFPNQKRVRRAT